MHPHTKRIIGSACAAVLYVLLLHWDALEYFSSPSASPAWLAWVYFGVSALVSFSFLAVGLLVFYYARARLVARVLFAFSLTAMITFALETSGAVHGWLALFSEEGATFAVPLFFLLLLVFPRNHLVASRVLQLAVTLMFFISTYNGFYAAADTLFGYHPAWLDASVSGFDVLQTLAILVVIIVEYFQSYSSREREQFRLLLMGVILAFIPFLVLTEIPLIFVSLLSYSLENLPTNAAFLSAGGHAVNAQVSCLFFLFLPLVLGYAVLRNQVLVADSTIRHLLAWMMGGVTLIFLGILLAILGQFLGGNIAPVVALSLLTFLVPGVLRAGRTIAEHLLQTTPVEEENWPLSGNLRHPLEQSAYRFILSVKKELHSSNVSLFLIDEDTERYYHCQTVPTSSQELAQQVLPVVAQTDALSDGIGADTHLITSLAAAERADQSTARFSQIHDNVSA